MQFKRSNRDVSWRRKGLLKKLIFASVSNTKQIDYLVFLFLSFTLLPTLLTVSHALLSFEVVQMVAHISTFSLISFKEVLFVAFTGTYILLISLETKGKADVPKKNSDRYDLSQWQILLVVRLGIQDKHKLIEEWIYSRRFEKI